MRRINLTPLLVIAICSLFACNREINRSSATPINGEKSQGDANARRASYPSYNTNPLPPDPTGMSGNAVQLASKIKLGINIGNTLEAIGGETAWGNPQITKSYIDFIKQSGFNAVRIPCSWDQYANASTAEIQAQWLDRVKQVVQYCIDDSLYAILNIHWDGGWLDNNITTQAQASVNAKQKAFWEQIATKMRDFDEHLLFASANEPPVENATQMNILLSYHQTFINAVRSTGGRNTYRVLVVQAPSTDIDKAATLMNTLPTDPTPNRMMTEVHYYSPYQFCLMSADATWGNMFYYWGQNNHSTIEPARNATWGEEDYVIAEFQKMKAKFADKGIPVILGEFGAYRRSTPLDMEKHQASVDHWATFVTNQAIANGLEPFWWDTGGLLSRSSNTVLDQRTLNSLIQGAQ
ncbi:glycoside hydrolase family 5 protein [Niastella vici]|nr:glycoside hydrolase family 5 protein [Niastella vici]